MFKNSEIWLSEQIIINNLIRNDRINEYGIHDFNYYVQTGFDTEYVNQNALTNSLLSETLLTNKLRKLIK